MGRKKPNPKYNVISLRVSADELSMLNTVIGAGTRQKYLHSALIEKIINDRQDQADGVFRGEI